MPGDATNKAPVDNLQEVDLNDEDEDSSDSENGEAEAWNDEEESGQAPLAPAPSPIPLNNNNGPSSKPNNTVNGGSQNNRVAPTVTPSATLVKELPPAPSTTAAPPPAAVLQQKSSRSAVKGKPRDATPRKRQPRHEEEDAPPKPKPIVPVKLELVKEQLLGLCCDNVVEETDEGGKNGKNTAPPTTRYPFLERLANGGNDAFLQHMLMLAYYRATDDYPTGAELRPTVAIIDDDGNVEKGSGVTLGNTSAGGTEEEDPDVVLAEEAANSLLSLWRTIEGAYTSMVAMLPKVPHASLLPPQHNKQRSSLEDKVLEVPSEAPDDPSLKDENALLEASGMASPEAVVPGESNEQDFFDEPERPVVVPDLLPPCTSARGDVTIEFFRACQGRIEYQENDHAGSKGESEGPPKPGTPERAVAASTRTPLSPSKLGSSASSVFSSMLSTVRRNSHSSTGSSFMSGIGSPGSIMNVKMPGASGFNVFRKNSKNAKLPASENAGTRTGNATTNQNPGEYTVQIEREMLGLTVENVLERTVVRTVLAGGPAKKAGAKVGSLIVKVGSVETKNLTHFETIDELRQSQRPLQLVLRLISDDALRSAREEMGRLIRGSGFGIISNGASDLNQPPAAHENTRGGKEGRHAGVGRHRHHKEDAQGRPLIASDLRIDAYTSLIRERFLAVAEHKNKNEETVERAAEKLIWILNLFVLGLERESARLFALAGTQENPQDDGSSADLSASPKRTSAPSVSIYHHTAKDFADAARSVSKILLDFVKKNLDPAMQAKKESPEYGIGPGGARVRKKGVPTPETQNRRQPMVPGMQSGPRADSTILHDKPLLQIGDILHRTRTFLVDPTSPPAALIRGELIAFLCDVLDIDKEMELSEEEAVSATAGEEAGPITDLGSAGSLLKLIVLNCSIMRSPECESVSSPDGNSVDLELMKELRRRFGGRAKLDGADVHRLHAGNRFLSVVHRLAASRSTSARITACSLGPVLWGHLDFPHQLQLRGVITRALHDAEVIVRKSTATVLHEIAELVFDQRAVPWLILMCERAMTDPEPQLRSAAMTLTWHLAEHLPNAFLGDASQGSRFLRRLPNRSDPVFADVYLLQCKLLPVATRLAEDRAPSVRLAVAAQCDRLCNALGDHWSSVIIDVLLALLTDTDERVRCEAVVCVPRLSEIVLMSSTNGNAPVSDFSVLEALLPAALMLQKDPDSSVRVSLATAAGELLTLLVGLQSLEEMSASGNEVSAEAGGSSQLKKHVDDVLIPLVQSLLHDTDPEVTSSALRAVTNASRGTVREMRSRQMSVASEDDMSVSSHGVSLSSRERKDPVFLPVLSEAQVLRLLPTLSELGNSKQWRVRQSAVEIVPALLGCTRNIETRREISQLCVRLMEDHVDAVRKTAAECLCLGGSTLGSHGEGVGAEWITSIVVPHLRKCAVHPSAKQRLLSLKMIEAILLSGACPAKWAGEEVGGKRLADSPMREFAVIALSLANDKVPNVRLNVGRALESAIHVFEEDALSFIKEVLLQQLVAEKERPGGGDRDVLFFSTRCIRKACVILEEVPYPQSDDSTPTPI
ncbi:protein phosphatase 2, regulatory subunit A, beta [Seminavis robusta]|uniref:Protein phosphatase 2, regulatory subunit A, beta n=1 Tax=Seminavis robusta TaxID=568900 RepID=A0A9N8EAL3_9STRA|nr:protein phosphatase 2, regulatory subunit A, beta [Seminavis robusta]|eukprot:Sro809_g205560.1 protein phosphatase 2, regulatory subunit A, beta (1564) ;mRNA; f:15551-20514